LSAAAPNRIHKVIRQATPAIQAIAVARPPDPAEEADALGSWSQ
jgi:hypothetical protein